MKTRLLSLFCLSAMLIACKKGHENPVRTKMEPARPDVPSEYFTKDSFFVGEGPTVYLASTLYQDIHPIDTILKGFGWDTVDSGKIIFERIKVASETTWNESKDSVLGVYSSAENDGIQLYDGKSRIKISDNMPMYSDFSSPSYKDGKVYYWGLKKEVDYRYRIYAMRYDVPKAKVDSIRLFETELGTDDEGYFNPPKAEGGKIVFVSVADSSKWNVDESFRNAERENN